MYRLPEKQFCCRHKKPFLLPQTLRLPNVSLSQVTLELPLVEMAKHAPLFLNIPFELTQNAQASQEKR